MELLWIADHLVVLDVWHNTIGCSFVSDIDKLLLAEMLRIFALCVLIIEAFDVNIMGDLLSILSSTL